MSDATRRLINIVHLAEQTRTPSLLFFLDAEKAFERVHWEYLKALLHKSGFQDGILSAIMALYTNPSALVYKMLSMPFQDTNGTRQGCPPSPLIFKLVIEFLAEHIRSTPSVSGFLADNLMMMIT